MALRFPWETETETDPPAPPRAPARKAPPATPKPRGRRPTSATPSGRAAASIWRYHHLTIIGPAGDLADFAAAAQGPGIVPWAIDGAAIEEDIFRRAMSQPADRRSLSVAGCRILARQFRDRIEARAARAQDRIGTGRACPFDLQVLVPIPAAILRLGQDHPQALAWLAKHWGILDPPRQVRARPNAGPGRRLKAGHGVIGYSFFTAVTSPLAAVATITPCWPGLDFRLRQIPMD